MHHKTNIPFSLLLVAFFLSPACKKADEKTEPEHAKAEPESRVKVGTNGQVSITLDIETQKLIGLQVSALRPASLDSSRKAYGRVLDPSPLAPLAAELQVATANLNASQAELDRLKSLAPGGNASERALQSAQAMALRDRAQLESARLRLLAGWSPAIAERADLVAFVTSLVSLSNALVELSLPVGEPGPGDPLGAQLVPLAGDTEIPAQYVGPAAAVDPQLQGRALIFLVSPNSARLVPGTAVSGYVSFPGQPVSGVLLPPDAVVRYEGETWVYAQAEDTVFGRTPVTLERWLKDGWFVRDLPVGTKVVTIGAQNLLSDELKSRGGEE
jgi:multidrug efflux pump subunit AcrA (membrane-fusion protein)